MEEKGLVLVGYSMIGNAHIVDVAIPIPRGGLSIQDLQAAEGFALLLDVDGNLEACGWPQGPSILPRFTDIDFYKD